MSNVLSGSRQSSVGESSEIFNTSGVYVFCPETLNTEMSPIEKQPVLKLKFDQFSTLKNDPVRYLMTHPLVKY